MVREKSRDEYLIEYIRVFLGYPTLGTDKIYTTDNIYFFVRVSPIH